MSDDLVKRLKETIEFGIFDAPNPVTFDECLAEIEYLRADLASACAQLREAALDERAHHMPPGSCLPTRGELPGPVVSLDSDGDVR